MRFYGRVSRRVVAASGILLGAAVLLGLVPWNVVAAEPQGGEERSIQRLATVQISQSEKDKPKVVLCAPRIVFVPAHDAMMKIGDKARSLEIRIRSLPDKEPMEHMVEVRLIRDPEGENPVILAAPKITLTDGATGKMVVEGPATLEIEATVEPVK